MRNILFKAKRVDNGEWVEGSYIYNLHTTIEDSHYIKQLFAVTPIHIDGETVCQFIKNHKGLNLFEGDKVIVQGTKKTGKYETFIKYDGNCYRLNENKTVLIDMASLSAIIQITGNLHD